MKGVCDKLHTSLDYDGQKHLLFEEPWQQSIKGTLHHHKEEAEVNTLSHPISIQVHPCTHLVAMSAGVERDRVQRHGTPSTASPCKVINLPQKDTIVGCSLEKL